MFRFPYLLAASAAVLVAVPAAAQETVVPSKVIAVDVQFATPQGAPTIDASVPAGEVVTQPVGPTVASGIVGVRARTDAAALRPAVAVQRVGKNPALMIVGATAVLVGAVIGGDAGTIVMVGGAALGLIGLWSFLR